jgi:hypothetical protein
MEPMERPKPEVLENVKHLMRKEKSAYKPSDMWTQEDDLLFLKFVLCLTYQMQKEEYHPSIIAAKSFLSTKNRKRIR